MLRNQTTLRKMEERKTSGNSAFKRQSVRGALPFRKILVPTSELIVYGVIYVLLTAYAFYSAYYAGQNQAAEWNIVTDWLGIRMDITSRDWLLLAVIWTKIWKIMAFYLILSRILRHFTPPLTRSLLLGGFSVVFVVAFYGLKGLAFTLAIIVYHLMIGLIFRGRVALWIGHYCFYYIMYTDFYRSWFRYAAPSDTGDSLYSSSVLLAMRCAMVIDNSVRLNKPIVSKETLCTFLHYIYYPPTMVFGPLLLYEDYLKRLYDPIPFNFKYAVSRAARLIIWAALLRGLMYIPFLAFLSTNGFVPGKHDLGLLGAFYLTGIRFYLVYIQFYGLPNLLTHLEAFESYDWPNCISYIYSYAEMWKTFDVGLYKFIKDYIYIPLGGSRCGFARQALSVAASFVYIWIYHGIRFDVFIWCVMNFVQLIAETCVVKLYYSQFAMSLTSKLSPAWTRRLMAFLGTWGFHFSCIGFFYFDIGVEPINSKLFRAGWRFWTAYTLFGYVLVHLAIECHIHGWHRRKKSEIKNVESVQKETKRGLFSFLR